LETVAFRYRMDPTELAALNPQLAAHIQPGARIVVHQPPLQTLAAAPPQPATTRSSAPIQPNTEASVAVAVPRAAPLPQAAPSTELAYPNTVVQRELTFDQIREVPASANVATIVRAPREEIVPDDLDYLYPDEALVTPGVPLSTAAQPVAPATISSSAWIWPTWGEVARDFAPHESGGQGIDIAGVPGQEIHAASSGTVAYAGRDLDAGVGKLVILRHSDGLMTTYSHAAEIFVAEDDVVRAGDVIASLGANARNESVLRFEVRQDGNPLNPMNFLTN